MNLSQNITLLKNIDNALSTNLSGIKTDVDTLAKQKIIFNARLTDGTNEYLARADYDTSPINFYWQNDKGTSVYITNYRFCYTESSEPTSQQLYHSTGWDSKIGALNSAETDYEAPYVTVKDNMNYVYQRNPNASKQQWVSNTTWVYQQDFDTAPIEIGVSRKFGHYIAANIDTSFTSLYDTDPVGIIEGYYYAS